MKVFLFDIDGTLIHTGGAGQAAFASALTDEFDVASGLDGISFTGRTDRAILQDIFQRYEIDHSQENWERFRSAYLERLPELLHEREGRVLPGVLRLLEHLGTTAEVSVGLLTGNVRDGARAKLAHFGLWRHFAFGGFGDDHVDRAEVARQAVAAYHDHQNGGPDAPVGEATVCVIGDTPHDVSCARAIGAVAVAVATGWHPHEALREASPDLLLDDLSDLSALLALFD